MDHSETSRVVIRSAVAADKGEIYSLQRAAFVDEAQLYGTVDTPAFNESFGEFLQRLDKLRVWVAIDQKRIIGAVILQVFKGVPHVERLMVAPDRRGEGVSTKLLAVVEHATIDAGFSSLQLIVGDLAVENQKIYEHLGWKRVKSIQDPDYSQILLHIMTKKLKVAEEA